MIKKLVEIVKTPFYLILAGIFFTLSFVWSCVTFIPGIFLFALWISLHTFIELIQGFIGKVHQIKSAVKTKMSKALDLGSGMKDKFWSSIGRVILSKTKLFFNIVIGFPIGLWLKFTKYAKKFRLIRFFTKLIERLFKKKKQHPSYHVE